MKKILLASAVFLLIGFIFVRHTEGETPEDEDVGGPVPKRDAPKNVPARKKASGLTKSRAPKLQRETNCQKNLALCRKKLSQKNVSLISRKACKRYFAELSRKITEKEKELAEKQINLENQNRDLTNQRGRINQREEQLKRLETTLNARVQNYSSQREQLNREKAEFEQTRAELAVEKTRFQNILRGYRNWLYAKNITVISCSVPFGLRRRPVGLMLPSEKIYCNGRACRLAIFWICGPLGCGAKFLSICKGLPNVYRGSYFPPGRRHLVILPPTITLNRL